MQKVAFHTLGCKLNFSETSTIARQFIAAGWDRVAFPEYADVYVINTCSVTENADKECRTIVHRALSANPQGKVIIIGCYAQLKPLDILNIPGVDLVLGANEKFNVIAHLAGLTDQSGPRALACSVDEVHSFYPSWSGGDRTRSFLKVQDGCDYNCSFCTIPLARGSSRSDTIANVVRQAQMLVQSGVMEVVLTGVNLGDFGIRGERGVHEDRLIDLLLALEKVEGLNRIRLSSVEPNLVTDEMIGLMASSPRFMPHFHMPLQSGSDKMLASMRRRYRRDHYAGRVEKIHSLIPGAAVGADVIVGYPGETEEEFRETFDFLHSLPVSYLHVFTYSERDNTRAVEMGNVVPFGVRKQRNRILRNLSLKKSHEFYSARLGVVSPVLFEEENKNGYMYGYTPEYIRVFMNYDKSFANKIISCRLLEIGPDGQVVAAPVECNDPVTIPAY